MYCSWSSYYADFRWCGTSKEVDQAQRRRGSNWEDLTLLLKQLRSLLSILLRWLSVSAASRNGMIEETSPILYPSHGNNDRRICAVFHGLPQGRWYYTRATGQQYRPEIEIARYGEM